MLHLDKGIFLEDKNLLLAWGQSIKSLATDDKAQIKKMSDRIVIEWGTHTILDGLTLELTTVFLSSTPILLFKKFKSIGHHTVGDRQSFESFDYISKHLLNKIGEPSEEIDATHTEREKFLIWHTNEVKISLYLYEQHAFKLHFSIEKK